MEYNVTFKKITYPDLGTHIEYDKVDEDGIYHCEEWGNIGSEKLIMSKDTFVAAFNKFCK